MLWFLVVGVIAGWLAGMISRGGGFGIWGDLITGIVGSYIGGFLFNLMGIATYGLIGSIIASTIGAIVLLWVIRLFRVADPAYKKKE
ncbi:GlsB/YeaQ/YmgE family stress response membrane protein [Pelosinus propionicus]|uniref:Uncharacterized membrane protein YeaQ/YmgE, transglycosylase-associated protein family n=1 Tax=Pelosinus propionicus DSM 13327 TaxID=1123291 RepID=A0A1I4PFI5_9FIRM|nr:GlsB/YeaQ/YmgE family stress response membrane protein [Pelosinus propionicus]SFM26519.1 Uncharacterized membrane protein YeaQ/YmgE, transglycosylase-associated protein family [Pelosinus propionicus DSM 13327]